MLFSQYTGFTQAAGEYKNMKPEINQKFKIIGRVIISLVAAAALPAVIVVSYVAGAWLNTPPVNPAESSMHRVLTYSSLFPFAFVVALIHSFLFGLPAFLLGFRLRAIYWWSCLIVAFLIGFAPSAMVALSSNRGLLSLSGFGVPGAIGGLTFWLLWYFWISNSMRQDT